MTLYDPVNQTAQCLDAREVAPIAATKNMFRGKPLDSQKGLIHFFTIELNPRVEKNSTGCSFLRIWQVVWPWQFLVNWLDIGQPINSTVN